jgi:hypothetical protein
MTLSSNRVSQPRRLHVKPSTVAKFLMLCVLVGVTWFTAQAVQTAQQAQKRWPGQYPRAGTTKMYEDDRVIVWDDTTSTEPFFHQHVRDSIYFYIVDGPIEQVDVDGKVTKSGPPQPVPRFGGATKAGRGPHSERSIDPNNKRRMFRVEFKGTEPADCKNWSTDPACNK